MKFVVEHKCMCSSDLSMDVVTNGITLVRAVRWHFNSISSCRLPFVAPCTRQAMSLDSMSLSVGYMCRDSRESDRLKGRTVGALRRTVTRRHPVEDTLPYRAP